MISLSKEIKSKLDELSQDGFVTNVTFSYPERFSKLPCITFYEVNNSIHMMADNMEFLSEINYVVDIWANTLAETSSIAVKVNEKLKEIEFIREVSYDIPETDIKHKFMRFKTIRRNIDNEWNSYFNGTWQG